MKLRVSNFIRQVMRCSMSDHANGITVNLNGKLLKNVVMNADEWRVEWAKI